MGTLWVLIGLILAAMVTAVALAWMDQLVRGSNSACELYPYASGCR
jgi:predicted PurR-regulated permease PerM